MFRQAVVRPMGVALGVGAALTAFGLATPASAAVDCTDGVTVDAVEADIRAAIVGGETLICVNPGTIDMSPTGTDQSATPFDIAGGDVTIIALGEVVLDGGGNAPGAFRSQVAASNLTVDGFTFIDFTATLGVVSMTQGGTLSVLNSTFSGNAGRSSVYANSGVPVDVVVENTVFDNNESTSGQVVVWGYSGVLTVNNSSFIDNEGRSIWSETQADDVDSTSRETVLRGNFFENNTNDSATDSATVLVSTESSDIYNNTFVGNIATNVNTAIALSLANAQESLANAQESRVWFNTFVDNSSLGGSAPSVFVDDAVLGANFLGNIWATGDGGTAIGADAVVDVDDLGGNFSTSDDSAFLDSSTSRVDVSLADLELAEPADNGGATYTVAIGADSVAIDAVNPADFVEDLESIIPVDQRGDSRSGLYDAGAFEYSASAESGEMLADTGIETNVIGLVSGGLLAGGAIAAAVSAVRRRTHIS